MRLYWYRFHLRFIYKYAKCSWTFHSHFFHRIALICCTDINLLKFQSQKTVLCVVVPSLVTNIYCLFRYDNWRCSLRVFENYVKLYHDWFFYTEMENFKFVVVTIYIYFFNIETFSLHIKNLLERYFLFWKEIEKIFSYSFFFIYANTLVKKK